jgi:hypothetical protein
MPQSERAQPLIRQSLAPGAHSCLFRGFQGINYKCGPVLLGLLSDQDH